MGDLQLLWLPAPVSHHLHHKSLFSISNLSLPSFSLNPSPLVLSLFVLVKSPSPAFLQAPLRYCKAAVQSLQSLLISVRDEQPQFSLRSDFIGKILQPSDHLCHPPLHSLQHEHFVWNPKAEDSGVSLNIHEYICLQLQFS